MFGRPFDLALLGQLLRSRARIGVCTLIAPTVRPRTLFFRCPVSAHAGKGDPMLGVAAPSPRFVALDVHRQYVMVAAIDAQQQVVLPPVLAKK